MSKINEINNENMESDDVYSSNELSLGNKSYPVEIPHQTRVPVDNPSVSTGHELTHSHRFLALFESMCRPAHMASWSVDEVVKLGNRFYPMQLKRRELVGNHSVPAKHGITDTNQIPSEQFVNIHPRVANSSDPTTHELTHSYRICPSLLVSVLKPVDNLVVSNGKESTSIDRTSKPLDKAREPVNGRTVPTVHELTHTDQNYKDHPKNINELAGKHSVPAKHGINFTNQNHSQQYVNIDPLVPNPSDPTKHELTHSYRIFPSLFKSVQKPVDSVVPNGQEFTNVDGTSNHFDKPRELIGNHSVPAIHGLKHNDRIYSEQPVNIHPHVSNPSDPNKHGLTHSYHVFPSLFESVRKPVNSLVVPNGQESTKTDGVSKQVDKTREAVNGRSVSTGHELTHANKNYKERPKKRRKLVGKHSVPPKHGLKDSERVFPEKFANVPKPVDSIVVPTGQESTIIDGTSKHTDKDLMNVGNQSANGQSETHFIHEIDANGYLVKNLDSENVK